MLCPIHCSATLTDYTRVITRGSGYQLGAGDGGGRQCGLSTVTMRDALRRRCLWWVCLAAAARVVGAAPDVVTEVGGRGQCEVLSLGKTSPVYPLPTDLTISPSAAGWRLDVTVGQGKEAAVCVRLEDKQTRLRLTVLRGSCNGTDVTDYNYLYVTVPSSVWTSLTVDVAANTVIVSAPDGTNTSVMTRGPPLPRDGKQMALTGARNVEVAVGCGISCPGYRHASLGNDIKETVKQWSADNVQFYFRPGIAFVKLEYEVACTTPLGHKVFPLVADIMLKHHQSLYLWHAVNLEHHSGRATVRLDDKPLNNKTLPEGCTFTEHTIRVMGDGLFSFTCNPFNGNVESTVVSLVPAQADMSPAVVLATVATIMVVVLGVAVLYLLQERRHLLLKQSNAVSNGATGEAVTTNNTNDNKQQQSSSEGIN